MNKLKARLKKFYSAPNAVHAFAIGALFGAIIFIWIYGTDIIPPTSTDWIFVKPDDVTQHQLGWMYYRRSDWTFPIGLTGGLYSEGKVSCMFTDAIPLFAVFFKLLSPILPENFQYFGMWGILCFALNGGFGAALLYRIKPDLIYTSIGSLFYALFPPTMNRITHHNSLGAVWLLLIAMILFLDHNRKYKHKFTPVVLWCVLGMLAVLIHMYFIPMIFTAMIGYLIITFFKDKNYLRAACTFGCTVVTCVLTMWIIGAFHGDSSYSDSGFGYYSANINTFFNSSFASKFIKPMNNMEGQYEGFGYLGLGALLCLFIAVIFTVAMIEKKEGKIFKNFLALIKKYRWELISAGSVFIIGFCWAVSTRVALNGRVLFEIELPDFLLRKLSIFRASGRFIWLPCLIVLTTTLGILSKMSRKTLYTAIVMCAVIQSVDLRDWRNLFHSEYTRDLSMYKDRLSCSRWEALTDGADEIVFVPLPENYQAYMPLFFDFGKLAYDRHMTLSCFYLARADYAQLAAYSQEQYDILVNDGGRDDALYVFFDEEYLPKGLHIETVDKYFVYRKRVS